MTFLSKIFNRPARAPPAGEATGKQDIARAGIAWSAMGGAVSVPPATYATYRAISAHPTIALARGLVTAPILAGSWSYHAREHVPAEWAALVRSQLEPLRSGIVRDALRALEFGWYAFEKIYDIRGGRIVLSRLKPLLPDLTEILVDGRGNFAGLKQADATLPPEKCFVHTYDGEAGHLHGRSRHENIRKRWSEWEAVAEKAGQYQKKVASIVCQVHYPQGTARDESGAEISNYSSALRIAEGVAAGKSVVIPNLFAAADDVSRAAELAGKSQYVLSFLDPGGTDFSSGFVEHLRYLDSLLFRGWLRPERSGLEGLSGARAEAQVHTDAAVVDSELIDAELARAVTNGIVDDLLVLNFGEAARGAVRVTPSPIVDRKLDVLKQVLTGVLAHPLSLKQFLATADLNAIYDQLDIPRGTSAT